LGYSIKKDTFTNQLLAHRHPCFRVSPREAPCRPNHALRDRGSIVPTIYLYVSHTEALLMASKTGYRKHLHGLHQFTYHIIALFTACKHLAILAHDLGREGSILLGFI
jgi:hypothetical protein